LDRNLPVGLERAKKKKEKEEKKRKTGKRENSRDQGQVSGIRNSDLWLWNLI